MSRRSLTEKISIRAHALAGQVESLALGGGIVGVIDIAVSQAVSGKYLHEHLLGSPNNLILYGGAALFGYAMVHGYRTSNFRREYGGNPHDR